jgi:flagellar assembly protein FliH
MGLIKAQVAPHVVNFQWRDVEADAQRMLSAAQRQSETIVRDAQTEAAEVREAARVDGFQRGYSDGLLQGRDEARQAAISEYSQQLELTIAALHEAVAQTVAGHKAIADTAVSEMVELAIAIAQRVTKRQAMIDPQVLLENLRESMALAGRQKQVRVAIHPVQRQVLSAALPQLQMEWPALGAAQIVEDPSLLPGGCRVFTDHGQIDADVQAQLDRVIAGLIPARTQEEAA